MLSTIVFGATACALTPPISSPAPATADAQQVTTRLADTVWYISTRARVDGRDTRRLADSLEYGYAIHSYRRRADVLVDGIDLTLDDSVRLARDEFVLALRTATAASPAPHDFALLSVHGYSTSLHECWRNVAEARARSRSGTAWVAFCWPSNGLGVAVPRRGAFLDRAYRDDSIAAVASQRAFVHAAEVVLEAVPPSRLMFVAHSMGAQLLSGALMNGEQSEQTAFRARLSRDRARAIAFVAPDIDASRFVDSVALSLAPLTSRLVAYTSGRDRMLLLSRQRSGTPRAGLRQRTPWERPELETVDVTDGLVAENGFHRIFGTHHGLRRASALVFDLIHIVGAGRAADCRITLGTASLTAAVWTLTSRRPEIAAVAEQCALVRPAP